MKYSCYMLMLILPLLYGCSSSTATEYVYANYSEIQVTHKGTDIKGSYGWKGSFTVINEFKNLSPGGVILAKDIKDIRIDEGTSASSSKLYHGYIRWIYADQLEVRLLKEDKNIDGKTIYHPLPINGVYKTETIYKNL